MGRRRCSGRRCATRRTTRRKGGRRGRGRTGGILGAVGSALLPFAGDIIGGVIKGITNK